MKQTIDKSLFYEVKNEYSRIATSREVNDYMKVIHSIVKLDDGSLCVIEKTSIKRNFTHDENKMYGMNGVEMTVEKDYDKKDIFIRMNLLDFGKQFPIDNDEIYLKNYSDYNKLTIFVDKAFYMNHPSKCRKLNDNERKEVLKAISCAREDFIRRLEIYWKKFQKDVTVWENMEAK